MKWIKRIFKYTFFIILLGLAMIILVDGSVELVSKNNIYQSADQIPSNKVGLLLGTGKILSNGRVNLYYKYRIDAAVKLYQAGKIEYILVSGDNSTRYYDEPTTIKKDLVGRGIPASKIYLDYAGFRTLDSVVRSKKIFGQDRLTVISQQFHNERAIFIGKFKGVQAVGFNAKSVSTKYGLKVTIRERLARVKMMLDLLVGVQPKFLGEKIRIG